MTVGIESEGEIKNFFRRCAIIREIRARALRRASGRDVAISNRTVPNGS